MTTTPLVEVRGLERRFGSVTALDGVSLSIERNEFFALLGPSGCGKTTLLRVLAGFEYPDQGTVNLDGADLLAVRAERRPVNLMFQSYALFPHMSVERNVAYGLESERVPRDEIRRRVGEVLETVGLSDKTSALPGALSGGQRQRVALARAIVKRPQLLLLDEPLSALDRKIRGEMQSELKRLQHEVGITFVVVTHDQDEAMSLADRMAVMRDGQVVALGTPAEVYRRPTSVFVADFLGDTNLLRGAVVDGRWRTPGIADFEVPGLTAGVIAVSVRPEDITLCATSDDRAATRGVIGEVLFQGDTAAVDVVVPERDRPIRVAVRGSAAPDVARGGEVGLTWAAADCVPLDRE